MHNLMLYWNTFEETELIVTAPSLMLLTARALD